MATPRKRKRLLDAYIFAGFRPQETVKGVFGDPVARVVTLTRRSKKPRAAPAGECIPTGTTGRFAGCAICLAATCASIWTSKSGAFIAGIVSA